MPALLLVLIRFLVVAVRRCHDFGNSGILLVFVFAEFVVLGVLGEEFDHWLPFKVLGYCIGATVVGIGFIPGENRANRYGPPRVGPGAASPPRGPDLSKVDETEPIEPVSEETAAALRDLDDRELLRIAVHEPGGYSRGAVEFARDEVTRRGL